MARIVRRNQRKHKRNRASENARRRIERRLGERAWCDQSRPMFSPRSIKYEFAERGRGIDVGGIGAVHQLARRVGLVEAIDRKLHLLKLHLPYHESDHVLNIAYNVLCGGSRIEHIELRRNDEVFLDSLGAQRIPDPTTAGDFCRRFGTREVETLMDVVNEQRLGVWKQQPEEFFNEAFVDADGALAPTTGDCKQGMDLSYKGTWGYHPLIVSLANTQEPLYLVNRSGNRPSSEGAAERLDQAAELCRRGGFRKITLRGDTDFSQTQHLDRWDEEGYRFVFGFDARKNLIERASTLEGSSWRPLNRRPKYRVSTVPRCRPENVKEEIVTQRGYKRIVLDSEQVAEFRHQPTACDQEYRMIVLRKNLTVERGEIELFDDIRYFFYITNDWKSSAETIVFLANDRCNQENLIEQLKNGLHAFRMPVDNLVSNWAYMVMASLAWTLKAWFALLLPAKGRWKEKHAEEKDTVLRMEFKGFVNSFVRMPTQIVKTGRRIFYRMMNWNPWRHVFLRLVDRLEYPLLA